MCVLRYLMTRVTQPCVCVCSQMLDDKGNTALCVRVCSRMLDDKGNTALCVRVCYQILDDKGNTALCVCVLRCLTTRVTQPPTCCMRWPGSGAVYLYLLSSYAGCCYILCLWWLLYICQWMIDILVWGEGGLVWHGVFYFTLTRTAAKLCRL